MDTYFLTFHSNKTYVVQQVIGITCVMLECQKHPLFYTNRLYFLIHSFQLFLSALHITFSSMITPMHFVCDTLGSKLRNWCFFLVNMAHYAIEFSERNYFIHL